MSRTSHVALSLLLFLGFAERGAAQQFDPARGSYVGYRALTQELQEIAAAAPDLVRLSSLATTPEGRQLWMVEVAGRRSVLPVERRPAFFASGGLHAVELAGTNQVLHLLRHLTGCYRSDERVRQLLDTQVFYLIPRVAPDGDEHVLTTFHRVRRSRARKVLARATAFALEQATYVPNLEIAAVTVMPLDEDLFKIAAVVRNEGKVPTSVTRMGARAYPYSEPVVRLGGSDTVSFITGTARQEIEHLEAGGERRLVWVVCTRAETLSVEVSSARGWYGRRDISLEAHP